MFGGRGNNSVTEAWSTLSTGHMVFASLILLAIFVLGAVVGKVVLKNLFMPIAGILIPNRAITNDLTVMPSSQVIPSKWSSNIRQPMLSHVLIDEKLRGDELQNKLNQQMS